MQTFLSCTIAVPDFRRDPIIQCSRYMNMKSKIITNFSSVTQNHTIEKQMAMYLFFQWKKKNYIDDNTTTWWHMWTLWLPILAITVWRMKHLTTAAVMQSNFVGGAVWLRLAGRTAAGKPIGRNLQSCCSNTDPRADDWPPAHLSDSARCHHPTTWWRHSTQVGGDGRSFVSV